MLLSPRSDIYLAAFIFSAGRAEHRSLLEKFSVSQKTAATILLAQANGEFYAEISDPYRTDKFELELSSDHYVSKGDWRWVNLIKLSYRDQHFLDISFPKKLIDLPYKANRLNARWLLNYTRKEFITALSTHTTASLDH